MKGVCARFALVLWAAAAPAMAAVMTDTPAQGQRFPANEDLRHYRTMEDVQLSPDGRRVLMRITDATADGARGHLWFTEVGADSAHQLTYSPESDKQGEGQGRWLPDGSGIVFLARRSEHMELFRLPLDGGEATRIEVKLPLPTDVAAYAVAPNGKLIALLAPDPQTPEEVRRKGDRDDASWVDHDSHQTRLYLLDLPTSELRSIPLPAAVRQFAWSHDSTRLVVVSEPPNNTGSLESQMTTWTVSVTDPTKPTRLTSMPKNVNSPLWSFDDRSLIFRSEAEGVVPPDYFDLYAYDLATGAVRNLSKGFEGSFYIGHPAPILTKGGEVVELVDHELDRAVAVWSNSHGSPRYLPLTSVSEVATNEAQTGWVFSTSRSGHPPELRYSRRLTDVPRKLATPTLTPAAIKGVEAQRISWTNENLTIQGLLYLPPEASATHRVPLIVDVHGGPTAAYLDTDEPFVDFLVGQGWAVLRPNPRGSIGRGVSFATANRNDLGGGDYRDIMAGVDSVLHSAPIDPNRLAFIGYSYGGEMAAFVEGKTTRFKAIVSGAPVIDQFSEYGNENNSWYDEWFLGKPWEHFADTWRQSPLSAVAAAKTPFLLLQGQNDTSDPPGQSYEMYRALRQVGAPVQLVTYPREEHMDLALAIEGRPTQEPWHGFDARRRMVELIEQEFKGAGEPR